MKRALLICATLLCLNDAYAWGPKMDAAVVSTAAQLISKEGNIPLRKFEDEIREGAMQPMEALYELYPEAATNPVRAIENEMYLLQSLEPERMTPYFAFRLGALGKLVANVTSPLYAAPTTYRNSYFTDAEAQSGRVTLVPAPRRTVEAEEYFDLRMRERAMNEELILREYQSGVGFGGTAQATFSEAASRSVHSISDVWYTLLSSRSVAGGVSDASVRDYIVRAISFYARRGNPAELEAAAERLTSLTPVTAELAARVGDAFYEADAYEPAIRWYERVIEIDPNRREVVSKISEYYVGQGERALEENRLEDALASFESAVTANALDPRAEQLRLQAEDLIIERDARLEATRAALSLGNDLLAQADQAALSRNYAQAISLVRQAHDTLQNVSDEFPLEFQQSLQGVKEAESRLREMKDELVANALSFSGSGFNNDARALARSRGTAIDEHALRTLLEQEYESEVQELQEQLRTELAP